MAEAVLPKPWAFYMETLQHCEGMRRGSMQWLWHSECGLLHCGLMGR
jgi:hypothetical protein